MVQPAAFQWKVIALLAWLFTALPGQAAEASSTEFISRNWRREDGLPDNAVQAIRQTRNGYLWIGTARGLARYDGFKFTAFDRTSTPELKSDDITCLAEDGEGNLWIGTESGLVGTTAACEVWTASKDSLANQRITALVASREGGVWVGTKSGLWRRHHGRTVYHGRPGEERTAPVECLHEDASGVLWVGTRYGFWRLDPGSAQFRSVELPPASGLSVEGVQAADRGGLWVLLNNIRLGTQLYHFHNGQWESTGELMDSHPDHSFLAATRSGDLWLSVHYASVKRVRDGRFTTHPLTPDSASVVPQCAFEDREGNLWIGTEKAGIYRWHPRRITSFSSQDGLSHEKAWTICESPDGGVWIGTDGGLSRFRQGAFTNLTVDDGLPNRVVRALATDRQGSLWVGTLSGLAHVADDQVIPYKFPGAWFSSKIRAILIDRHHRLWVGSASGLHRVALPDDSESQSGGIIDPQQSVSFGTSNGLSHDDISALLEDDSGRIWIGSSGGLNRMDGDRMEGFSHLPSLANGNVGVLYQDDKGTIWIGAESGLHCFRDGTFTAFTTKEGLFDDLINSIVEDNQERLWFGGDRGIYCVPKTEFDAVRAGRASRLRPVIYDDADGLPSGETNGQKCQPAAGRTKDGRLWFPTTKGVVVLDPGRLPDNTNSPPVVIEQIRANGRIVNLGGASSTGPAIHFPAGSADVLEIHYTATTFIAPERVRFKYQLEGQDNDWVEADGRRAAYYTNLRPGQYRFHVIAANSHGFWNESGAAIGFYVAPHYHQTWAFRLACAFGGLLLVGGIYRWRVGEMRKVQSLRQQAALLDERARIARNLHDGLGANLTQLTLLADLADQGHPDAVRERVRILAVTSRETARALRDLLWATHPSDESLEGLIARICQEAQEFCAAVHIRCRFDLPGQLPEHVLAPAARQSLFLAAKEALNNVAKHARASEVVVRVRMNQSFLILEIEDNGCGFDPENALPAAPTRGLRAKGRGLENLRCRAREAGGEFVLESGPGKGTKVRFNIPLSKVKE